MGDFRSYPSWRWTLEPGDDFVQDFLMPALVRARRYDRQAGFFSSSCLLVSAKGVEHLLRTVPRTEWPAYRLIVCERLDPEDVEAIASGEQVRRLQERLTSRMLQALEEPADAAARDRLALLAAMVAVGFAEIRVAVPCGPDRRPRPGALEHAKVAILHDWVGNTLVAFGSANESWQGWVHNNEQMDLYASWEEPAWSRYGRPKVERFERLWQGTDPIALTLDLPTAVCERLIALAPEELPPQLVQPLKRDAPLWTPEQEAVVLQFLRDAPRMRGGRYLGMTTAAVVPWPHHVGIVDTATGTDTPRFLLCDEVGLGKTIEAAFILRQLRLEGRARRILILAPRSLCEQWQDELWGKFSLPAAFYDGSQLLLPDPAGRGRQRLPADRREVFAFEEGVLITSAELMRRRDRQPDLLQAPHWDLIVVDEAHHARREGFDRDDRPPNRLLALLRQLSPRTRGLLLLTATPMQVDPREVWDLLRLLGVRGPLGEHFGRFLRFYALLARLADGSVDRPTLDELFEAIRAGAEADPTLVAWVEQRHGLLVRRLKAAVELPVARDGLTRLDADQRAALREFLLAYAPTRQRLFRTTRDRLRIYRRQGLLTEPVPERRVQDEPVPLSSREREIYREVERYLARHYRNARTGGQRGLGFVLTCYRKRLSSSPYALRCSLERLRRRVTDEAIAAEQLLDEDDLKDETDFRADELEEELEAVIQPEALAELEVLLEKIAGLMVDSKLERLHRLLDELFRAYPRVIVFTQYRDTMVYLRESLRTRTTRIGCYSGAGAELYDAESDTFVTISKDELQERLRGDNGIQLLVCTDAAAEGLNLQACGALVNYDMPWNPMRVEQRIGRIDRIGQRHPEVRVINLFATPSVEDLVYRALTQRIGLFERFIGPLQPILGAMQRTIQQLAMMDPDEREHAQAAALAKLEDELQRLESTAPEQPVSEGYERPIVPISLPASPVTLEDLKRFWLRSPTLLGKGALRPVAEGVYELRWEGQLYRIAFNREVAERRAGGAVLFTYGHPCFEAILARLGIGASEISLPSGISRIVTPIGEICYFLGSKPICDLRSLLDSLEISS